MEAELSVGSKVRVLEVGRWGRRIHRAFSLMASLCSFTHSSPVRNFLPSGGETGLPGGTSLSSQVFPLAPGCASEGRPQGRGDAHSALPGAQGGTQGEACSLTPCDWAWAAGPEVQKTRPISRTLRPADSMQCSRQVGRSAYEAPTGHTVHRSSEAQLSSPV